MLHIHSWSLCCFYSGYSKGWQSSLCSNISLCSSICFSTQSMLPFLDFASKYIYSRSSLKIIFIFFLSLQGFLDIFFKNPPRSSKTLHVYIIANFETAFSAYKFETFIFTKNKCGSLAGSGLHHFQQFTNPSNNHSPGYIGENFFFFFAICCLLICSRFLDLG